MNTEDVSKGKVMNFVTEYMKNSEYDVQIKEGVAHIAVFARSEVFVKFQAPFIATGDVENFGYRIGEMSKELAAKLEEALLERFEMKCVTVQVTDNHHAGNPTKNEFRDTIRVKWL